MNFFKHEVHQPKDSDFIDVVYAFDVPRVRVHINDSLSEPITLEKVIQN